MTLDRDEELQLYLVLLEAKANAEYDLKLRLENNMNAEVYKKIVDRVNNFVDKFEISLYGKTLTEQLEG